MLVRRQGVPGRPRRGAADEGQAEGERRAPRHVWSVGARRAAPAEPEPDRAAGEAEPLAQRAHQVALVGEVERGGIVDEQEEGRRAGRGLRPVEDLERLAVESRRRAPLHRRREDAVQLAGRDLLGVVQRHAVDGLEQLAEAGARVRGGEDDRRVGQERQPLPQRADELRAPGPRPRSGPTC